MKIITMTYRILSFAIIAMLATSQTITAKQKELTASLRYNVTSAATGFQLLDSFIYTHSNGRNTDPKKRFAEDYALFDKAGMYTAQPGGQLQKSGTQEIIYDANGNYFSYIITGIANGQVGQITKYNYSYFTINGKKLPVERNTTSQYLPNPPHFTEKRTIKYNSQGLRIAVLDEMIYQPATTYEPLRVDSFWYDGNGNTTQYKWYDYSYQNKNWLLQQHKRSSFDANNVLLADTTIWNGQPSGIQVYTYTNGLLTETNATSFNGSTWQTSAKSTLNYDANGNLIDHSSMIWDKATSALINFNRFEYKYDSDNQLTEEIADIRWQNGAWTVDFTTSKHVYRYSMFPLTVNDQQEANAQLSLYPSPAVSNLHIDVTFKEANEVNAHITTADGRLVKRWSDNKTQQYSKNISVMDLAAGTYYLTINAGGERVQKSFVVVR